MSQREQWGSNIGFILATIGSAIGLGNIWRFPYIVGENGGGAFLIPYVIITVLFGLIFMLIEFAVGRRFQTSVISALININRKFAFAGIIVVVVAFAILSYYLVVLGWILAFFVAMSLGINLDFDLFTQSYLPIASFAVVVGICFVFIKKGISKGIEKLNKVGILLLVGILIPLTIYGITLPNSDIGIQYYLNPDFSLIDEPEIWATAFGQVFFSLSIGIGILLTYGSYQRKKTSLLRSSSIIIISNAMVSFIAGLLIFSIVFSFGLNPEEGSALVFKVLPSIFETMEYGNIFGIIFFLLLLIAGITSAVSIFQVPVSTLEDTVKISKTKSVVLVTIALLVVGSFSALSYSPVELEIGDSKILDFMDENFGSIGLSVSAIILITIITWGVKKSDIIEELNISSKIQFSNNIIYYARIILPITVAITLIASFLI